MAVPTAQRIAHTPADPQILHPLDQLRGTIRRFVLFDGLLAAGLFLLAWFWVGLAADFGLFKLTGFDWVQDAPWALRGMVLVVMLLLLGFVVATRVVLRLNRRFSYPALAMVLEKRYPKLLGDRLITAVELADVNAMTRYGYSPEMIRQTINEARERVARVPVNEVFNWGRLRARLFTLLAIGFGLVLASYLLFGLLAKTFSPAAFAWRSADVVSIWAERNLLLQNTPWPRRAYLELVGFPDRELRIGKDAPPPKVRVRAYEWVVADDSTRDGWRPLRWADLHAFGVAAPEALTVQDEQDWRPAHLARAGVAGAFGLPLEKPVAVRRVALADMTVDEVSYTFGANNTETADVFARLDELAARPANSRTLRRLTIPAAVQLTYVGKRIDPKLGVSGQGSTRGSLKLTREPSGEFSAEVGGLKESVSFVVRAEDFRTDPRDIILVPPPMLTRLARTERQPAYLYHPAPLHPTGTPGTPDFGALKGLHQSLGEKDFSLTGDKSIGTVPVGTELTITGVADKPLERVHLIPRSGRVPGATPGSTAPVPVPVDGDKFTVTFDGPNRITESVEFDVVMTDFDGVQSSRPVVIQANDDQAPQVEVAVDVLRKVGNAYLVTPKARVPFVKESIIRDDNGLSNVEFQASVVNVESASVVGIQAQALARVFGFAPAVPGIGAAVGPTAATYLISASGRGEQRQFVVLEVAPFERAYADLPKDTPDLLRAKLGTPPANPDRPPVVRDVKFGLDADVFDLQDADARLTHKMLVTDPEKTQGQFRIELNIVATDTNVETGPKKGQNLEPIRLLVVSEADLLAAISEDEQKQIGKLDDALARLRDAQRKLNQESDRLVSPSPPPDVLLSARVRAEDITQDLGKARDLSQGVATEYARLKQEVEYNRVNQSVPDRYQTTIIDPLEKILRDEFKAADEGIAGFREPLFESRRPDDPAIVAARSNLAILIERLQSIRASLGEALSVNKLRDDLRKIIDQQRQVGETLARIRSNVIADLFEPEIKPAAPVVLTRGGKATVKHAIDWKVYDKGELTVRFEPTPDSGLKLPASVVVKDDRFDFDYEIAAGEKAGEFTVRVIPSVGKPVEVKVTVK